MAIPDQQHALAYTPGPQSAQTKRRARHGAVRPTRPQTEADPDLQELWRAAFESNPAMYFVIDAQGLVVSVNGLGAEQLGYAPAELVGKPVLDVFVPADRASVHEKASLCFVQPGRSLRWEARKLRKDGTTLWVRETANAVMWKDRPVLLVACEDVTERKRAEDALRASEERFRTLVEFSFDVYWETDAQHRFVRQEFGPTAEGAPSPGAELGKTRWEVPYVEPGEEAWQRHRATLEAHLPFRDFELARPTADGGKRYVSVSGLPVFDEAGTFVGYRGVGRHITERKRAEEMLRAHVRFLENMDRIHRTMQGTNDLERMMSDVLDAVLDVFACDRAWLVYPCDPAAPSWRAVMEHTRAQFPGAFALHADVAMTPAVAEVFHATRSVDDAVVFAPASAQQVPAGIAERFGVRSQMAMAVRPKVDRPYLFGVHQCSHARVWSEQDKRLFEEIGHRLQDALTSLLIFRSLRDGERKLEEAQRIAHLGYFEADLDRQHLVLSDEACRIWGLQPPQLAAWQGRFLQLVHPDDRGRLVQAIAAVEHGEDGFELEFRALRPGGGVRIVHSRGEAVRDAPQGSLRAFGTIQDITELRHAQELTRHIFDTSPDAMVVIGRDYRYQRVNPVYERNWKMAAERIVGLHVTDLFGQEVFEQTIKPNLDRCFAGEQVSYAGWFVNASGRFYYSVIYAPLRLGSGHVEAALAITRDLTDHMLASEALREAEAALARVNRVTTLGVLTASIAHEVNQPLGAMITSAAAAVRWLGAQPPELDKAGAALKRIVADGRRAGQVVDRIRALVNRRAPRRDRVDLNEALLEVIALTRDEMRRHAVTLRTSLDPDVPAIEGDRVQIQQVVLNLLVNAIDAMGSDAAPLRELAVTSKRDDASRVCVEVRDTGPGIDPAQAERLFEAFYTTKEDGIGMGLSISRSIVEAHGGELKVAPNAPRGAAFGLTLPVRQPAA